uniref:Retrotransposon protein, putative, unclassified n=1 Tax=Oryza sativa subsp. japonica TaxID=39947 RepID=Q2R1T9_ORYSJ|nr:retrotransposon protein, putative, unclassified [Oryza sativa Japonica Group]
MAHVGSIYSIGSQVVSRKAEKYYLIFLTLNKPKKWKSLLAQVKWWYNTNFHTSLGMSHYQALHGTIPPLLGEFLIHSALSEGMHDKAQAKATIVESIKARMKYFAVQKHSEQTLDIGDMVYLKIQPYSHNAIGHPQFFQTAFQILWYFSCSGKDWISGLSSFVTH